VAGRGELDELPAPGVGLGSAFDQAMGLELVGDEGGVRGVVAVASASWLRVESPCWS